MSDVGNFAAALAAKQWKYSIAQTKAMVIQRTSKADGSREAITCDQAIGELSLWEGRMSRNAFTNTSDDAISDMICDTFLHGATIHTAKAAYVLWNKPEEVSSFDIPTIAELSYEEMEYAA